ncbi:MAG: hypothetical protein ACN6O3_04285 [Comamonas sp.]
MKALYSCLAALATRYAMAAMMTISAACAANADGTPSQVRPETNAANPLIGYQWTLQTAYGADGQEQSDWFTAEASQVKISFAADGLATAELPCTLLSWNYAIAGGDHIKFQHNSIAGHVCAVARKAFNFRIVDALEQAQRFKLQPG